MVSDLIKNGTALLPWKRPPPATGRAVQTPTDRQQPIGFIFSGRRSSSTNRSERYTRIEKLLRPFPPPISRRFSRYPLLASCNLLLSTLISIIIDAAGCSRARSPATFDPETIFKVACKWLRTFNDARGCADSALANGSNESNGERDDGTRAKETNGIVIPSSSSSFCCSLFAYPSLFPYL